MVGERPGGGVWWEKGRGGECGGGNVGERSVVEEMAGGGVWWGKCRGEECGGGNVGERSVVGVLAGGGVGWRRGWGEEECGRGEVGGMVRRGLWEADSSRDEM